MDLLHAQFNNGPLSLDEVKAVLGGDFGQAWPSLQKKFSVSPEGLFFNERMENEKTKRKKHSEHQRSNALKRWKKDDSCDGICDGNATAYAMAMPLENENENRNESKDELEELEAGKTVEYCRITLSRDYDINRIRELWVAFVIQNPTHPSKKEKIRHFRNWIKTQPYEHVVKKKIISADEFRRQIEEREKQAQ